MEQTRGGKEYLAFRKAELFAGLERHHKVTADHSLRVAAYSSVMARFAGYSPEEVKEIQGAVLFHDIGKLEIPQEVLNKQTTRTEEEIKVGSLHPIVGAAIVKGIGMPPLAETVCAQHHERYDGSGYPFGLSGDEIDPVSHLVAYVDSFDAATTRSWNGYQKSEEEIYYEIMGMCGEKYAPHFQDAFEEFYQWKVWNHY